MVAGRVWSSVFGVRSSACTVRVRCLELAKFTVPASVLICAICGSTSGYEFGPRSPLVSSRLGFEVLSSVFCILIPGG